jgi:hypothetical protein
MHNFRRAAMNELFRNPTMGTISNFTSRTPYSKGWTKCPTWWASTLGHPAQCDSIVWLIKTTLATIITHVSFTAIILNALCSLCNSLRLRKTWCMLQQRNWMMLKNLSTQRWNRVTGGGMNRYISRISS